MAPGMYGDLYNAQKHGIPASEAHRAMMGGTNRPDLDERAMDLSVRLAAEKVSYKPREKKEGFWSRLNNAVGSLLGESKFTDQINGVIDIIPHVYRANRQLEFEATGDRDKRAQVWDMPWSQFGKAWRQTERGEELFLDAPATNLPALAEDIAKRYVSGQKERDISDLLGLDPSEGEDQVRTILSSPKVQSRMAELERSKVTPGRGVLERLLPGVEENTNAYNLLSGAIDFGIAFIDPTIVGGKAIKTAKATRTFDHAIAIGKDLDEVLKAPAWQKTFKEWADERSATNILNRYKGMDAKLPAHGILAQGLSETRNPEEAESLFRMALGHNKSLQDLSRFAPPRKNVVLRHNERWLQVDGQKNRVANLYQGMVRGFRDLPKNQLDPEDVNDAHQQISALMDLFPTAFKEADKVKVLDRVLATKGKEPDEVLKIVKGVLNKGGKTMKVNKNEVRNLTSMYNLYLKIRSWSPGANGDEIMTQVKESMRDVHLRLSSETVGKIPLFSPRELRNIRWAQGDYTKFFVNHKWAGDVMLAPSRITGGLWKTLVLATRPAWVVRVLGEEALRIGVSGKGVGAREAWRAINFQGPYAKFASIPPLAGFRQKVFGHMTNLPDDVIPGVMTGRSAQLMDTKTAQGVKATRVFTGDDVSIEGWRFMLQKLVNAPEVMMHMKGHTQDEIADMFMGEWKDTVFRQVKNLGSVESAEDIPTYLDNMVKRIVAHIGENPELEAVMRKIAKGELPTAVLRGPQGRNLLRRQPNPPEFVTADLTLGDGNVSRWAKMQETMFKYMMDIPTTRLNRLRLYSTSSEGAYKQAKAFAQKTGQYMDEAEAIVYYQNEWVQEMDDLIRRLDDEINAGIAGSPLGKSIGLDGLIMERDFIKRKVARGPVAEDVAKYALRDNRVTEAMILDSAKAYGINDVLATLYDPAKRTRLEQQLSTQFPFLAAYKEFIVTWTRIVSQNPEAAGKIGQLVQAQQQATFEDAMVFRNDEGKKIDLGPLNWLMKGITGSATQYTTPLDSFNMFSQSPYPGTGPMTQLFSMILAEAKPDWEEFTSFVTGGYGLRTIREDGLAGYGIAAIDAFLPAGLREMRLAAESTMSSPEFANRLAHEFKQIAVERFGGEDTIPWEDEKAIRELYRDAERATRATAMIIGLAKQVFPGSIQREYPYQDFVNQARAMMSLRGEDAAYEYIREQLGPGAVFLLEGSSQSDMPPTKEAYQLYQTNKDLAHKYGSLFWDLFENKSQGELAFDVYRWQYGEKKDGEPFSISQEALRHSTDWMNAAQLSEAWKIYTEARDTGEAMMESGAVSREQHLWTMRQVRSQLAVEFPYWGRQQGKVTNKTADWQMFQKDIGALARAVSGTQEGQGLQVFSEALEAAQDELESLGLERYSFDAESAIGVRDRLNRATQSIARDYPAFEPFYWSQIIWRLDPDAVEEGRGRYDMLSFPEAA